MLKKIIFWFKAKNRHGIHSKFVYDFLDKGLYVNPCRKCTPQQKFLLAALTHFKPIQIGLSPWSPNLKVWLESEQIVLGSYTPPYDFYIAETPNCELEALIATSSFWNQDAMLFVGGIRTNAENYNTWKTLLKNKRFRVVIETYSAGLLCLRPQQAPQHFKIRVNSSIFGT